MNIIKKLEDRRSGKSSIPMKQMLFKKCFATLAAAEFITFEEFHPSWVTAMDIDRDSRYLVSACNKRCLAIHDLHNYDKGVTHTKRLARGVPRMKPSVALDAFKWIQWAPSDPGMFTTSSLTVGIWDANLMSEVVHYHIAPSESRLLRVTPQVHQHHMTPYPSKAPLIAVASHRSEVPLVDIRNGTMCHHLNGHDSQVTTVRWSPTKEDLLATGDDGGHLKLWDVRASRSCLATLKVDKRAHRGRITGLEFTPDGHSLVSVGTDFSIRHWDVSDLTALRLLPTQFGDVRVVNYRPTALQIFGWDRHNVLFVPTTRLVEVRDLATGMEFHTLDAHFKKITTIKVDQNYCELYSAARDRRILQWTFRQLADDTPCSDVASEIFSNQIQ